MDILNTEGFWRIPKLWTKDELKIHKIWDRSCKLRPSGFFSMLIYPMDTETMSYSHRIVFGCSALRRAADKKSFLDFYSISKIYDDGYNLWIFRI